LLDGRCLRCSDLLCEVRGARFTKAALLVPAVLRAHPTAAARALLEERPRFFDGFPERVVVFLAAHGALDFIRIRARGAQESPEQLTGASQQARGSFYFGLTDCADVVVAALVEQN